MDRNILKLYFICGSSDCRYHDIRKLVREALEAGISCYQFREKGSQALTGEAKKNLAKDLQALCHFYGVPFIVNDDLDLALEIDADGVHIGQSDRPVKQARQLFPDKIIGLSVSNLAELQKSDLDLVDYLGVGPVFPTMSKADASPAVGYSFLKAVRQSYPTIPFVAIGGIAACHVKEIRQTGADGVAVISAIAGAKDIRQATKEFLAE
ncbi:thiamine phosphate synthase [Streptococcus dentiloxodontae]